MLGITIEFTVGLNDGLNTNYIPGVTVMFGVDDSARQPDSTRLPEQQSLKSSPARRGFVQQEVFDSIVKHLPIYLRPIICILYYCDVRSG
jgi:hypothetical protein